MLLSRLLALSRLKWLLLAGLLWLVGPAAAAPPPVQLRQPAAAVARLDELRQQREFRYVAPKPQAPNAWAEFWARFWDWVGRGLRGPGYHDFWRWVLYAALAAAVVFVVLKLLQVELSAAFGRAPRRTDPLAYDTAPENIHELDFAARLAEAEASGNYRLALRLGYLQLLKQLSDQELIAWQPDKTNQAYLRELGSARPPLRPPFTELTRQFEYVWYGEFPLAAASYQHLRAEQRQLGRTLGVAAS